MTQAMTTARTANPPTVPPIIAPIGGEEFICACGSGAATVAVDPPDCVAVVRPVAVGVADEPELRGGLSMTL